MFPIGILCNIYETSVQCCVIFSFFHSYLKLQTITFWKSDIFLTLKRSSIKLNTIFESPIQSCQRHTIYRRSLKIKKKVWKYNLRVDLFLKVRHCIKIILDMWRCNFNIIFIALSSQTYLVVYISVETLKPSAGLIWTTVCSARSIFSSSKFSPEMTFSSSLILFSVWQSSLT